MGNAFSTVRWESPTGGKFRIYSRFYDVYGLENWKPVEVEERIVGHPAFERVGECMVMVELKPNGTHEIEFRKQSSWKAKQVRFLDCALDGLPAPYHWWGLVIIRPHLRIAKEAADKIASATGRPVVYPIGHSAPQAAVAQEKEIFEKKVTISEDIPKKASSSGGKDKTVDPKKVETTVEEMKVTIDQQPAPEQTVPSSESSKKSKKKGKSLPEV
ncbi:uncharacterized protein I303_103903 [Kwoniella dejecticola CBS 10117]|uniref:Uncharacterized protein n=1 Tax=Kwoniella dejecticola CBS 10117 TaxID=1296121 RepID=A0A1A6A819_9TREE|nr:uncharacterized protein I303_03922 [Kwoniella dejecticola CBS 10117]OBR86202.1 hypothetical protein I303_03922 [Kwoniella dejecticola CBS 10117]